MRSPVIEAVVRVSPPHSVGISNSMSDAAKKNVYMCKLNCCMFLFCAVCSPASLQCYGSKDVCLAAFVLTVSQYV